MVQSNIMARENRVMIKDIKSDISEIKIDLKKMSNHYSKRLPAWATTLFMILTAIIGGLITRVTI